MRLRPLYAALLVGAAFATSATAARADDPRKPEAQKLLDEGLELHDKGREQEALDKFNAAYKIYPSPNLLFEIARTQKLLGNFVQALRNFRVAIKNDLLHPKNRALSLEHIAELEKLLARVEISGPPGTKVVVGDQTVTLPLSEPLDVEPGTVLASGSKDDARYEGKVVAQTGKVVRLDLTPIGKATTSEGHPPDVVEPPPAVPSHTNVWPYVGWSLVGAGVAAAGVGVGFVFASNSSADERDRLKADPASSQCPSSAQICADLKDAAETRASRANVAKVLLGAGGAAIIGGVVVLLVNPGKRSATATAITPLISPSLAGVSAAGRF